MAILKISTVYNRAFLMVSSSDHITGKTGISPVPAVSLSKNGGAFGAALGTVTEIANGWYNIALTAFDTNTIASPPGFADLAYHCTGTGADPTDFVDQVYLQTFADIVLSANGRVMIANSLQQNTALSGYPFQMVDSVTGAPKTGLTVTAQRTLGGGGFAPCTNAPTEIANGWYAINLSAADLNNATVGLLFTATGAANLAIEINPTP